MEKLLPIKVGALYMEMGTGKTRTALEMIKRRQESGKIDRVLWLCPCSVKTSLRADIKKHAEGALSFIAIHGIESLSSSVSLYAALDHFIASVSYTHLFAHRQNSPQCFGPQYPRCHPWR